MDFVKFSFSRTSPTSDGTSTNYIYEVNFKTFTWEISRRFSEFETLLENVCSSFSFLNTCCLHLVGYCQICSVARASIEDPPVLLTRLRRHSKASSWSVIDSANFGYAIRYAAKQAVPQLHRFRFANEFARIFARAPTREVCGGPALRGHWFVGDW